MRNILETSNNAVLDQEPITSSSTESTPVNGKYRLIHHHVIACKANFYIVNNTNYNNLDNILASTSCLECNRPKLYCNCKKPQSSSITTSATDSSEGSLTPPISSPFISGSVIKPTLSYPDNVAVYPTTSAGLTHSNSTSNSNNNSLPSSPIRHLTIPIHDPSDDIDSDTPIYKSVEETTHLGEFTNKSSEELMSQIYSGFPSSTSSIPSTSSSLMNGEAVDELVELSREI